MSDPGERSSYFAELRRTLIENELRRHCVRKLLGSIYYNALVRFMEAILAAAEKADGESPESPEAPLA